MHAQALDDLEHEVERVLADPGPLGHVRAQTHSGEDRLDRVTRAQVQPVLGREVVEGDEVVPVAVDGLGRGVLGLLVKPEPELVAGGLAEATSSRSRLCEDRIYQVSFSSVGVVLNNSIVPDQKGTCLRVPTAESARPIGGSGLTLPSARC